MSFPRLETLFYHRDYDGVVAASMVLASASRDLSLHPVQYAPQLNWTERQLGSASGIVDFLFHPDAALWVDHHSTTFSTDALRESFSPDAFHIFEPDAASCPGVIARQPWFEGPKEHWADLVKWADIIDGARYDSPRQANDLTNPHVLLSHVIGQLTDERALALIVIGLADGAPTDVLDLAELRSAREQLIQDDALIRQKLPVAMRVDGKVATLDQSRWAIPYRRYLAYEMHPEVRYGIGLYRSGRNVIVSVGENPWGRPGPVHLGNLCREFGGGGRRATAGIPVKSQGAARELAVHLVGALNRALENEQPCDQD